MAKLVFLLFLVLSLNAESFTKSLSTIGWHQVGVPINSVTVNSSTFSTDVDVVWQWDDISQNWKFYSTNQTLKDLATSINVPIISELNKGDAVWVKNSTTSSKVTFENTLINTSISQDPADYDNSVLKIGSSGQILADTETQWKAIYIKEANIWVENKSTFTGSQKYTHSDASNYCSNLILAGKDDWYLPSISELSGLNGVVNNNTLILQNLQNYYWSKNEYDSGYYYYYILSSSSSHYGSSSNTFNAICFRKVQ